jgi:hypothetical protein
LDMEGLMTELKKLMSHIMVIQESKLEKLISQSYLLVLEEHQPQLQLRTELPPNIKLSFQTSSPNGTPFHQLFLITATQEALTLVAW